MKFLIVLSALVAFAAAKPQYLGLNYPLGYSSYAPLAYSGLTPAYSGLYPSISAYSSVVAPSVVAPSVVAAPAVVAAAPGIVKSQYHSQDELGQASYGHVEPFQSHTAVQDIAGNKVGSFSYVSPDGRVLRTDYVADGLGYRVASNALPVGPGAGPLPVVDTPEVAAAKAAHLALHGRAKRAILHTPAATAPLATAIVAPTPLAYSAPIVHPYAAPIAHTYASPIVHPYAAPIAHAYAAPAIHAVAPAVAPVLSREATLTTVVNNPGHAISYRVD